MITNDFKVKVIDFGNSEIKADLKEDEDMQCNLNNFKYFYTKILTHLQNEHTDLNNHFELYVNKNLIFRNPKK